MLKIRRPLGRLIFNMGIAIPGKTVFLIETAPSILFTVTSELMKGSSEITVSAMHNLFLVMATMQNGYNGYRVSYFCNLHSWQTELWILEEPRKSTPAYCFEWVTRNNSHWDVLYRSDLSLVIFVSVPSVVQVWEFYGTVFSYNMGWVVWLWLINVHC